MNKKLLMLPLIALLLTGCNKGKNEDESNDITSSESYEQGNTTSDDPTNDGSTIEKALSVSQAIKLMKEAGDGVVVSGERYVKGTFDVGTTVNAKYHQWYGSDGDFAVSGATNDSGKNIAEVDGNLDGLNFVVKGYLELYEGEYKVGYLPAGVSPTGQKYVPSLVSLDGTSSGGSSNTGTKGESISNPLSVSEAIDLMKKVGDGKVVSGEKYVTGTFQTGTTVNSKYHEWYGNDGELKVSGAKNESGTTVSEKDGALDGYTFIVKGYLELYQGEYKIGYLPASVSPTGEKYSPTFVSLTKGGSTGGSQNQGSWPSDLVSLIKSKVGNKDAYVPLFVDMGNISYEWDSEYECVSIYGDKYSNNMIQNYANTCNSSKRYDEVYCDDAFGDGTLVCSAYIDIDDTYYYGLDLYGESGFSEMDIYITTFDEE